MIFQDRGEAGKKLAEKLIQFHFQNPVVLALPRGGVPVGLEIAKILQAPLEVVVARKIGAPGNPEFGIGAISEGGVKVLDEQTITLLGLSEEEIENLAELEKKRLQERVEKYRKGQPLPSLEGKVAILVDDGLATGITAKAAIEALKKQHPQEIILATPVCARDRVAMLKAMVGKVVCLITSFKFKAVGTWYKDFRQISDEEVVEMLATPTGFSSKTNS